MSPFVLPLTLRRSLLPVAAIGVVFSLPDARGQAAQANPNAGGKDKVVQLPASSELRKSKDDAKALAKANNVTGAENALTRTNRFQANTPEWHLETSHKLVETARELTKDGFGAAATALVTQSLQHLNQTASIATDARTKAQAKASAAVIYERFVGDPAAAITNYQAALQFNPDDVATKEALERLQKADAALRARIRPAKK
jgi:hypothetical protein